MIFRNRDQANAVARRLFAFAGPEIERLWDSHSTLALYSTDPKADYRNLVRYAPKDCRTYIGAILSLYGMQTEPWPEAQGRTSAYSGPRTGSVFALPDDLRCPLARLVSVAGDFALVDSWLVSEG